MLAGAQPTLQGLEFSQGESPACSRVRRHAKRLAPGATYVIPGLLTANRPASRDAIPAGTEALLTKSRGQEDRDPPDEEDSFNRVSGPRSDSRSGAADADGEDERQDHHRTRVGGGRSHQGVGGNQETTEGGGSRRGDGLGEKDEALAPHGRQTVVEDDAAGVEGPPGDEDHELQPIRR